MRIFTNFLYNKSAFQAVRVVPNGVSATRPVKIFSFSRAHQLSNFYIPTDFFSPNFYTSFSYKYFFSKWSKFEQRKSYNQFFKSSGAFPALSKPFGYFENFVPKRKKSKFYNKAQQLTLYFKNQPIFGAKSFLKYRKFSENNFIYFSPISKNFYKNLAISKKFRILFPKRKFFRNWRKFKKKYNKFSAKKRFYMISHRFYVIKFFRLNRKKKISSKGRQRRFYKFYRRIKKFYPIRRRWIIGNIFENVSEFYKFGLPTRNPFMFKKKFKFFFKKKKFKFKKHIFLVRKFYRLRSRFFRNNFRKSKRIISRKLLFSLGVSKFSRYKAVLPKKSKRIYSKFFGKFKLISRQSYMFRVFSIFRYFVVANVKTNKNLIKNFYFRYFRYFKKIFYISKEFPVANLWLLKFSRSFSLFKFFQPSMGCGFRRFIKSNFKVAWPEKISCNLIRVRQLQRRQFVKLYRFVTYFNLVSKMMIFPKDDIEMLKLKCSFFLFLGRLTCNGKHFYLLPVLFYKHYYFSTISIISPELYSRSLSEYTGFSGRPSRTKLFRLNSTY